MIVWKIQRAFAAAGTQQGQDKNQQQEYSLHRHQEQEKG